MLKYQLVPSALFRSWFRGLAGDDGAGDTSFLKLLGEEITVFEKTGPMQGDA